MLTNLALLATNDGLHVSKNTLEVVALVLLILIALFYLFGRLRGR